MPRPNAHASNRQLQLIAHAAARLMAEDGLTDYAQAKRKAALRLGLPDNAKLPDNAEIEAELRAYQRLFQDNEQRLRLAHLRRTARNMMARLQRFNPYLSGSVLDGTAGRHAEIDIPLFTDSAKDVEIYLLNRRIEFSHSPPRTPRAEAVLTLPIGDTVANLVIYPRDEERRVVRGHDGRPRPRARLAELRRLLDTVPDEA